MEWKDWIGKYVFIRTQHNKVYSGSVEDVDDSSKPLIFISIKDKFSNKVIIVNTEILEIKEEKGNGSY